MSGIALLPQNVPVARRLLPLFNQSKNSENAQNENVSQLFQKFNQTIQQIKCKESKGKLLTVNSLQDTIANISYFIRSLFVADSVSVEAMGGTTAANCAMGAIAALNAGERLKKAFKHGDSFGVNEAIIDGMRGIGQSLGGLGYLGLRITDLWALVKGIDTSVYSTNPIGRAAYFFGLVGNALFTFFYGAIGVWAAYCGGKNLEFRLDVQNKEGKELFEFLLKNAETDPKEAFEILKNRWENDERGEGYFKSQMRNKALDRLCERFLKRQEGLEDPLTKEELRLVFEEILFKESEQSKEIVRNCLKSLGIEDAPNWDCLTLLGFTELLNLDSKGKKEGFSKVANAGLAEKVRKAANRGLIQRLESENVNVKQAAETELAAIEAEVLSGNKENCYIHSALFAISVVGIGALVLSFVTVSFPVIVASVVLNCLVAFLMMVLDGVFLHLGLNGARPGIHDKKFLVAAACLITAFFLVSLGVTLAYSFPVLPLIAAAAILAISLVACGISYHKLTVKEEKWKENNPTLDDFLAATDKMATFKKLSKFDRQAIRQKYFKRGKIKFKNPEYAQFDSHADFGGKYLEAKIYQDNLGERDKSQVESAIKKTVKYFWEKWSVDKSEENKQLAIEAQELLDLIREGKMDEVRIKYSLLKCSTPSAVFNALKENAWYVCIRNDNPKILREIVSGINQERSSAELVKEGNRRFSPEFER